MPRLIALITALTAVWLAVFGVIRGQPEALGGIEALFDNGGCTAACVLGVRIGQMSADGAVAALRDHPWVGEIKDERLVGRQTGVLRWRWADDAPGFLDKDRDNILNLSYRDERVMSARLVVNIPLGRLYQLAGDPSTIRAHYITPTGETRLLYEGTYDHGDTGSIIAYAALDCPVSNYALWHTPALDLTYRNQPPLGDPLPRMTLLNHPECG